MKRIAASIMALLITLTSMAGCSSQNQASKGQDSKASSPTSETVSDSKTGTSKYQTTYGSKKFDNKTIKVELFDRSNAPEGSTITDNKWVKYVNEQMNKVGITVEFVTVPRWDEVTKMQAMMASGTSPDLTMTYTYSYAEDYFNQGGIWNLNDFIDGEDQAKNLKSYIGDEVLNIGRNTDKNLYGIVAKRATTAQSNLFLRKDWLDALGLAIPQTPDELYNVIYKMVKENPDKRDDITGAVVWNAWNMRMAFSQLNGDLKQKDIADGHDAIADYYDPGMREYYRFMNKMYNAGLLNPEYYTMSEDNFKSLLVTGSLGFFAYSVNGSVDVMRGSLLKTLQENVPTADVISIPSLKNTFDGKQYSGGYAEGGLIAFCPLTADETTVEACMTYLDWLSTKEGGFTLYHGFEGEHYKDVNGVPVVIDADYNSKDKDWIRADLFAVGNQGYFKSVEDFNACTSKEAPGYEQYVIDNYNNALTGTVIHQTTYTSPSTPDKIADITLTNKEYSTSVTTAAEADFDKVYDEYVEKLKKDGVQTIIDERTDYYTKLLG